MKTPEYQNIDPETMQAWRDNLVNPRHLQKTTQNGNAIHRMYSCKEVCSPLAYSGLAIGSVAETNGSDLAREPKTMNTLPHALERLSASFLFGFEPFDLVYALENAAEFLENEEWPELADAAKQCAANKEAARRIRAMAKRYGDKHL